MLRVCVCRRRHTLDVLVRCALPPPSLDNDDDDPCDGIVAAA